MSGPHTTLPALSDTLAGAGRVTTHPQDARTTPRCTCARSWGLHSGDCPLNTPGHELIATKDKRWT